jgi:A/G-specific adenine glycosylase
MELPGVGRYTAAAVASIAFGEPVAVVDGNVKRVIDRIVNHKAADSSPIAEKHYWEIAGQLLDRQSPGDFNQAMMEMGSLVCLPAQPQCHACPVADMCGARGRTPKWQRAITPAEQAKLTDAGNVGAARM